MPYILDFFSVQLIFPVGGLYGQQASVAWWSRPSSVLPSVFGLSGFLIADVERVDRRRCNVCSFWTYMLELTSVFSKVTVAETRSFLANVNSRSRSLYAIARPFVVCLSSVTFVRPLLRQFKFSAIFLRH